MTRIVIIRADGKRGFSDWAADHIVRSSDPCPITGLDMAERLQLKRAGIDELSRAWQITRLQAAVALFNIQDEGHDAFVYDEARWETVAGTPRGKSGDAAEGDEEPSAREDSGDARRTLMAERLATTPTTKEELARVYGVSTRTVDFDLDPIGAVTIAKDGRKPLWSMPTAKGEGSGESSS